MPASLARNALLGLVSALALSACSTPTRYEPVTKKGVSGFSETRVEENRFRVSFRGGSGESASRVKDLALLRAADLANANGFDWFEVVNHYTEALENSGPTIGVGGGSGSFGRSGGVGVGLGTSFNLSGPVRTETLEVIMGKGPKPDRPNTYSTQSVRETISPTLKK